MTFGSTACRLWVIELWGRFSGAEDEERGPIGL
jgi:hypothetical protein